MHKLRGYVIRVGCGLIGLFVVDLIFKIGIFKAINIDNMLITIFVGAAVVDAVTSKED